MLEIIEDKRHIRSGMDFLKLAKKIDKFKELNYSKNRKQTALEVKKVLQKERLLTP